MHYLAYEKSRQTANIIVDGAPNEATELTLSHWPNNTTPEHLRADLSAEIVFNYLDDPGCHSTIEAVSNNHFDADGLVGIYTLLQQDDATEMREFLIDIARAGDFDKYSSRDAARVSFVLDAWQHPRMSPLNASVFAQDYAIVADILYEELLPRFGRIIEKIDLFGRFWGDQDDLLDQSEDAFARRKYTLTEVPQIDLAVVSMPDSNRPPWQAIHRMSIHNQTNCTRVLLLQETNFELYYRYETWIELHSRNTMPRVDLQELAKTLSKQESMDGVWSFSGITDHTPTLRLSGDTQSKIPVESFKNQIVEFLAHSLIS